MDLNQTPYLMYFDKILCIFVDLFTYPTIARVSIVIRALMLENEMAIAYGTCVSPQK